MKVQEHDAAVNLAKLNLATRLIREVLVSLEHSADDRNAIIGPLGRISHDLRMDVTKMLNEPEPKQPVVPFAKPPIVTKDVRPVYPAYTRSGMWRGPLISWRSPESVA